MPTHRFRTHRVTLCFGGVTYIHIACRPRQDVIEGPQGLAQGDRGT
jgi:hypothetical protein